MQSAAIVNIVDDDEAVRDAIGMLMNSVKLSARTFDSARTFLAGFDPGKPGCIVLDVRMPDMSGLDLQRELVRREVSTPIIIITGHGDVPMAVRALKEGAMDFIEKPFHDQDLLDSISKAIAKSISLISEHAARARFRLQSNLLSARERQVMDMLVAGKCSKDIGNALNISSKTVDVHRGHILDKTGAKSIIELVHLNLSRGQNG